MCGCEGGGVVGMEGAGGRLTILVNCAAGNFFSPASRWVDGWEGNGVVGI